MASYLDELIVKYSDDKKKVSSEEKPIEKPAEKPVEKPVETPVEKTVLNNSLAPEIKEVFSEKHTIPTQDNDHKESNVSTASSQDLGDLTLKHKMIDFSSPPPKNTFKEKEVVSSTPKTSIEDLNKPTDAFESNTQVKNREDALSKLKSLGDNKNIDPTELQAKNDTVIEAQEETIEGATVIAKYDKVKIYRLDSQSLLHYSVPVPKPNPSQKIIINTLKEATTRLVSSDPYKIKDHLQRKNIYYQKVLDILETAQEINIPKHLYPFYADAVVKEMTGYGIIEPLLDDDKLEEIMIVGPKKPVYVYHIDYGMMTTNIVFYSDDGINDIIDKIARSIGRNVDIANPLLDARLPDGSRVNATVPPASIDGSTVTIRKFREDPYTIIDLINFKTLNLEVASFLWCVVEGFGAKPANILISGGTGSGKTTTLNVLANFIPESDRILTIEDTAELNLPIKHVIRFEGRPPGLEGKGELSLEILTKNTLRMRPDRIIVGEIRHKEATTLFTAMNTGHDGCMGTVHANSAKETIVRLTSPPMNVPPLMLAGIDFIIIQKRLRTAKGQVRRITAIAEIKGVLDGDPKINMVFAWNPQTDMLERTSNPIMYLDVIKTYTNLDDADIKKRISDRAQILQNLIDKKIRVIHDVSKEVQKEYILKR